MLKVILSESCVYDAQSEKHEKIAIYISRGR